MAFHVNLFDVSNRDKNELEYLYIRHRDVKDIATNSATLDSEVKKLLKISKALEDSFSQDKCKLNLSTALTIVDFQTSFT